MALNRFSFRQPGVDFHRNGDRHPFWDSSSSVSLKIPSSLSLVVVSFAIKRSRRRVVRGLTAPARRDDSGALGSAACTRARHVPRPHGGPSRSPRPARARGVLAGRAARRDGHVNTKPARPSETYARLPPRSRSSPLFIGSRCIRSGSCRFAIVLSLVAAAIGRPATLGLACAAAMISAGLVLPSGSRSRVVPIRALVAASPATKRPGNCRSLTV